MLKGQDHNPDPERNKPQSDAEIVEECISNNNWEREGRGLRDMHTKRCWWYGQRQLPWQLQYGSNNADTVIVIAIATLL